MFSMHQKTLKYCFFFVGSNSLYGSSYMSSCPRQVHYSWQLKHYLGPHNHRAVRMTYCLFWAGPQQMHAKSPYSSWCFEFSITEDFRPLLGNPLSQVYICHDSGLTLRELALSSCTKTVSPALHNVHCLPCLKESLHNAHWKQLELPS